MSFAKRIVHVLSATLAVAFAAACHDRVDEPDGEESVGEEIEDKAEDADEKVDEAADEAEDEVVEAF